MANPSPFKWFKTSPEIIRLAVMMYARFPLSLRNVEDLLHERSVEISHETVRFWWHRFGPIFAFEIRKRRIEGMKSSHWRRYLDDAGRLAAGNAPGAQIAVARRLAVILHRLWTDGTEFQVSRAGIVGAAVARTQVTVTSSNQLFLPKITKESTLPLRLMRRPCSGPNLWRPLFRQVRRPRREE
ncbi:hypothetical protein OEZ60_01885 [Defluviimonas sp. WL0024]|uniref:Transposase n=1 Tax=Albidovulum salinarum TaxID=2984153 RepID=A0ABT2WYI8_9RHOB|nr:hypothetical protein [Defluviimonas sp. WL0024]MCU9846748.1 hypothetical protein [Defluviimonas sp. WL0024]